MLWPCLLFTRIGAGSGSWTDVRAELFEQALLAYLDALNELRAEEWKGWELYIED